MGRELTSVCNLWTDDLVSLNDSVNISVRTTELEEQIQEEHFSIHDSTPRQIQTIPESLVSSFGDIQAEESHKQSL